MVAFVTSSVLGFAGLVAVVVYGRRRPIGAAMSWGEAMVAATLVFLMFFWWYGIIPHQWLTWADNELNWRPDRTIWGPGNVIRPEAQGGWLPVTVNYQHLRDIVAVVVYGVGLALHVGMWAWWNDREKRQQARDAAQPVSSYGRPLIRRG